MPTSGRWPRSPTHDEVRSVRSVDISMDHGISLNMLFDPGHNLDERILREQFGF